MRFKKVILLYFLLLIIFLPNTLSFDNQNITLTNSKIPTIKINVKPYSTVYEGDIIDCEISGDPDILYWQINNQSKHYAFYENKPIIFDPELTPLNDTYVNLTIYAENSAGNTSTTLPILIKRIFFGDIHWHSTLCDGRHSIDTMYSNAIEDNYLDFVAYSGHGEFIDRIDLGYPRVFFQNLLQLILHGRTEWKTMKEKAQEYYKEGEFTTFLGFEWSACQAYPGGYKRSTNGWNDVSHINFYYKDIYPNASKYSAYDTYTYDDIFKVMNEEAENGNLNIGFTHHPQARAYWLEIGNKHFFPISFTVNWSFLANKINNIEERNNVFRGAEVYSKWGTAIGQYSHLPIHWPYSTNLLSNETDAWVENALWEWSENLPGIKFVMMASSDIHLVDRPGSAQGGFLGENPAGLIAAYSIHNTRDEIWDAINTCDIYGTQLLKIRANVRFNDQLAYGQWINYSSQLKVNITALSTFYGLDQSRKNMCPHKYDFDELNHTISDIWLIKKDRDKGRPWCKIIGHAQPNEHMAITNFTDNDVQPNDFYYVAIRQQGQTVDDENNYMAFIGPVFIK